MPPIGAVPCTAFVIADDVDLFPEALREYLAYVRDPTRGYVSVTAPVGDAMEIFAGLKRPAAVAA